MLAEMLPEMARSRQVIAVDLQAHGRTADTNRSLRAETMADDIAGLTSSLALGKADVMGYSLGGAVALQTAIRHPDSVRKLVVVSAPCKRDGWEPETLSAMAQMGPAAAESMKQSPNYKVYAKTAPRPQDWPVLLIKLGELLRTDYDWSKEVASIRAPVLLVYGDGDAVCLDHMIEFFEILAEGSKTVQSRKRRRLD
jgi:pimeloyl-ACP methyl ester carboxylesterase